MTLTPVEVTPAFRRAYRKKPPETRKAVEAAVIQLRTDPRHTGLRTHRVWGAVGVYEARLDGSNRLTFHWAGDTIVLRHNCEHDKVLRRP